MTGSKSEKALALEGNTGDPQDLIDKANRYEEAARVLQLLKDKCRQGFLEISEGTEAYDELQAIEL